MQLATKNAISVNLGAGYTSTEIFFIYGRCSCSDFQAILFTLLLLQLFLLTRYWNALKNEGLRA